MSSQLPPGWQALQAPDGRWYYFNPATNTTQWEPPMLQQQQHGAAPQPQGYPGQAGSSSGGYAQMCTAGGPQYSYPQAVEFKIKEKLFSLSGDSFKVQNTQDRSTPFQVRGKALSLKDSKSILDHDGNAIYTLSEEILTLRGRMRIVDAKSKQPVVTLRKKGFVPGFGTGTIQIWSGKTDDGDPWLTVKGDFFRKNFDFKDNSQGRVLASVKRKGLNFANIVMEKDTYIIRVEPGVDAALMVLLVVAIDEQYRDDGQRTGVESRLDMLF